MGLITTLEVLRRRKGMTQTELGQLVGLTQSEVSVAERGKRVRRLDMLALALDIKDPTDLLLDIDEFRDKTGTATRELVAV